MPAITATAPGKCILLGEHAVVYQRPAIAVPVHQVQVRAIITPIPGGNQNDIWIESPAIRLCSRLHQLAGTHPIKLLIFAIMSDLNVDHLPPLQLKISSTIPAGSGLGSSASVAVAIIRAVTAFMGFSLDNSKINQLAYQSETHQHGNPSGIDNTVITYQQPIYFIREQPFELIRVRNSFAIIIADTGIPSSTRDVVNDVRCQWQQNPTKFDTLFTCAADLCNQARSAIEDVNIQLLGDLMSRNHTVLQEMTVSSVMLDHLVDTALQAGALGAKLSGGGRGGNMIALVEPDKSIHVETALKQAGAVNIIKTIIPANNTTTHP